MVHHSSDQFCASSRDSSAWRANTAYFCPASGRATLVDLGFMKVELSEAALRRIPIHDARCTSFHLERAFGGVLTLILSITINEREPIEDLRHLGITSHSVCLTFDDCCQVLCNFVGCTTSNETVDSWETITVSPLIEYLTKVGLAHQGRMIHHQFSFSLGSKLDVVAVRVQIEGCNAGLHI